MAFFSRIRIQAFGRRNFSVLLSPDSKTPLSSKEKTRAALSLIKSEDNPAKIIEICRAASLTPDAHLDRIAFSVAVSKLAQSNNFSYIQDFIDELRSSRPDLQNERFAAHAIVLFGQATMLDQAIRTFEEYHKQTGSGSVKAFNALLFACILAKKPGEVKRIFVEFPRIYNIEPNLESYNTVIKAFSESESSNSAYSILAEMDRKGVKPNKLTFGNWLAGLYKEEKYEDVSKVLEMMNFKYGVRPGISTYNIRIQSLCKLKRPKEAKALFDGMITRGVKPNSITYCHLIHGFCKAGDLEEAKSLLKSMAMKGCQPDADCYFTMVYFLCKAEDFDAALKICNESIEKKWFPNVSTMKLLVNGLRSVGKVEEAKELLGKLKENFSKNVQLWDEIEASLSQ